MQPGSPSLPDFSGSCHTDEPSVHEIVFDAILEHAPTLHSCVNVVLNLQPDMKRCMLTQKENRPDQMHQGRFASLLYPADAMPLSQSLAKLAG